MASTYTAMSYTHYVIVINHLNHRCACQSLTDMRALASDSPNGECFCGSSAPPARGGVPGRTGPSPPPSAAPPPSRPSASRTRLRLVWLPARRAGVATVCRSSLTFETSDDAANRSVLANDSLRCGRSGARWTATGSVLAFAAGRPSGAHCSGDDGDDDDGGDGGDGGDDGDASLNGSACCSWRLRRAPLDFALR